MHSVFQIGNQHVFFWHTYNLPRILRPRDAPNIFISFRMYFGVVHLKIRPNFDRDQEM